MHHRPDHCLADRREDHLLFIVVTFWDELFLICFKITILQIHQHYFPGENEDG